MGERVGDGVMVGPEEGFDAERALRLAQVPVAGNVDPVAGGDDRFGIARPTIDVDQQARIAGEDGRRVQPPGQEPRHPRRPDVVGDVTLERRHRQPQAVEGDGDRPAGVITDQQQAGPAIGIQDLIGRGIAGADQWARGVEDRNRCHGHGRTIIWTGAAKNTGRRSRPEVRSSGRIT